MYLLLRQELEPRSAETAQTHPSAELASKSQVKRPQQIRVLLEENIAGGSATLPRHRRTMPAPLSAFSNCSRVMLAFIQVQLSTAESRDPEESGLIGTE